MERLQACGVGGEQVSRFSRAGRGAGTLESRLPKWPPIWREGWGLELLFSQGAGPREDPKGALSLCSGATWAPPTG